MNRGVGMKHFLMLVLSLSFLIFHSAAAQEIQTDKNRAAKVVPDAFVGKNRILINNRIYRLNAPYVTLAYGREFSTRTEGIDQNMTLAYHHFFDWFGLRLAYHATSDLPPWWRSYNKLNDFTLGLGTRYDKHPKWNLAVFAGPSLAYGWYIAWSDVFQDERSFRFMVPGVHGEIQATYRPVYDLGVGLSVYGSYNKFYAVAGAQVHLYFSLAYVRNYD